MRQGGGSLRIEALNLELLQATFAGTHAAIALCWAGSSARQFREKGIGPEEITNSFN
jgi:hypothetical protein